MIEVINPILPVSYNFSAGVKGEYLPYIVNPDGTEEFPLGKEFIPNVITNIGIDRWLTNADTSNSSQTWTNSISWIRAGSGTTAAAVTDTALQTQLTDPAPSNTNYTSTVPTPVNFTDLSNANTLGTATHTIVKQFAPLVGASATINEIGLGWSQTTASTLFSRVVLPSSINLIQDQVLRVTYRLTVSIPLFITPINIPSTSGSGFNVQGTASSGKGMRLTNSATWNFGTMATNGSMGGGGGGCSTNNTPGGFIWQLVGADTTAITFFSCAGSPGSSTLWDAGNPWFVTGISSFPSIGNDPTGYSTIGGQSTFISSTITGQGAANNTKFKDRTWEWSITNPANTTSGITGIKLGTLLMLFDNSQTKSSDYRLRLTLRSSWARI
jgi:hypothetical protein